MENLKKTMNNLEIPHAASISFSRIIYSNGNNRCGLIINYMEIVFKKLHCQKSCLIAKKKNSENNINTWSSSE